MDITNIILTIPSYLPSYLRRRQSIFDDTNISYALKILFQQIQSKSVILHFYFHLLFALTFMGKDGKGH